MSVMIGGMDVAVWQLAERYWDRALAAAPSEATQLGDHRFDDRIDDVSLDAERDYLTTLWRRRCARPHRGRSRFWRPGR